MLQRIGREDLTVHGFRSTFRDWTAEQPNFPSEVAEAALAHVVGDRTEAAYRRGDLFDKRRRLMQAWADYWKQNEGRRCGDPSEDAVRPNKPLNAAGRGRPSRTALPSRNANDREAYAPAIRPIGVLTLAGT